MTTNQSPRRPRREFTSEFKADAVAMVADLGKSRAEVARDLDINESTLGRWVAKATGTEGTGSGSARRAPDANSDDPAEMAKEIARLKQENAFLKKAAAFFAEGTAVSAKYELIHTEEGAFPVTLMTQILGIERTGYYAWKNRQDTEPDPESRRGRRQIVADRVYALWLASNKVYGIRRIHKDLAAEGITVSLGLVAAIMRELGIAGVQPRATKRTTIPAADAQDRADLVRRESNPPVPTTHLVSDITYLKTGEGWLFLATVIDLTTRMVVGWATAKHMRTSLIIDALKVAYQGGYVAEGAIAHSDRGSQYTSAEYAEVARLMQVRLSVGRTGVCWDNAVAEAFFASLKNEMFHRQRFATRARARLAVAEYIEVFYNRKRRHSALGYEIPARAMESFFDRTETESSAADRAA